MQSNYIYLFQQQTEPSFPLHPEEPSKSISRLFLEVAESQFRLPLWITPIFHSFFFLPWPVFSHVPFFFFFALSLLRYKIDQGQLHCALVYLYFCKIKYNCFHFCKAILFLCIQDQYLMTSKEFLPTRQSLSLSKMF